MEGLVINRQPPSNIDASPTPNMNIFLNIPYANQSAPLLQFPSQTRKNHTKNLEGLEMPMTLNRFVETRKNEKFNRLKSYIKKTYKK